MNVLSLFDGLSCAQIAFDELGIDVENYYASENDKYAIKVTQHNYPDTIQLGDILNWRSWNIDFSSIDLIVAGFPCQSWSVAGKQKADNDPRGNLVHTLIDILHEVQKQNPQVKFIFENVKMKKEFYTYLTSLFQVDPILINSALVSPQNRQRLYWCNFPVTQPEDKGIYLQDIIGHGQVDRNKSYCIDANYFKGTNLESYLKKKRRQVVFNFSSSGRGHGVVEHRFYEAAKAHTLTKTGYSKRSFTGVYNKDGIRKLTVRECARCQTISENYDFSVVSNSQAYKMIGNGFTVAVIKHILNCIRRIL